MKISGKLQVDLLIQVYDPSEHMEQTRKWVQGVSLP